MRLNPDYFDMLKAFNAAGVDWRDRPGSKGIDICVDPTSDDARQVYQASVDFGTPLDGGEKVYIIGRDDLIKAKRAAGRSQDLEKVRSLEASRKLAAKE